MKDQLLINAVNIIFEQVSRLYDAYGEFINVNNIQTNEMLRISSAIETAVNIEYNYMLGKVVPDSLYVKAKRVHYQCKRELIRSKHMSFENAFDTDTSNVRRITEVLSNCKLRACIEDNTGGIYVMPTVLLDRISTLEPFIVWYLKNVLDEVSRRYVCAHIKYPPEMSANDMIKDINRRLDLKEQEMRNSGAGDFYCHVLSYMGIFDKTRI
jgi:hypothetical protein